MAEVASAFVSLLPSAKGFGSKLDSEIGGDIESSGKRHGKLFGTVMLGAAGAAIGGAVALGGFLKGSIGEAREAQKVGALTNAVIKSTGGVANVTAKDVDRLATSISLKTGVDDEAIAAGENMLLTFGNVRNEVGKGNDIFSQATVAATDMAAAFGGDAVSNSKMLGKALNDPTKGVSALTRVGVSFTQQQKDQIKTLQESGNALGAQKIILGEVAKQTAGAAVSQASAGDKAKVAFANLQETVGTLLLPVLDRMLTGFAKVATFLSANIAPAVARVAGLFSGGGGLSSGVAGIAATLQANFLPVLRTMATTFTTVVLPAILRLATYLQANLMPIFRQVAGIITGQVIPIVASLAKFFYGTLVPAIYGIVTAVGQRLKPVFDQLFKTIQGTILPVLRQLLAKFQEYQPTIQRVILIVLKVIGTVLVLAATILGKVLPPLIRLAGFLIGSLVGAVVAVIGAVIRAIGFLGRIGAAFVDAVQAAGRFATGIRDKVGNAVEFIASLPGRAKAALGGLGSTLFAAGSELVQGLINGITSKIAAVGAKMHELASKIKGFLPGSPVKEGPLTSWNQGGAGKRLVGLLADGLGDTDPVDAAMSRLTGRIAVSVPRVSASVSAPAGARTSASGVVQNIYETTDARATAKESARQLAWAGV